MHITLCGAFGTYARKISCCTTPMQSPNVCHYLPKHLIREPDSVHWGSVAETDPGVNENLQRKILLCSECSRNCCMYTLWPPSACTSLQETQGRKSSQFRPASALRARSQEPEEHPTATAVTNGQYFFCATGYNSSVDIALLHVALAGHYILMTDLLYLPLS